MLGVVLFKGSNLVNCLSKGLQLVVMIDCSKKSTFEMKVWQTLFGCSLWSGFTKLCLVNRTRIAPPLEKDVVQEITQLLII